jgi:hypothetical protein
MRKRKNETEEDFKIRKRIYNQQPELKAKRKARQKKPTRIIKDSARRIIYRNIPENKARVKLRWDATKNQVFDHYGWICDWCGETDKDCLTIDHCGKYSPRETDTGHGLYNWLVKNKFPEGFQTLCYKCNSGRKKSGQQKFSLINMFKERSITQAV